MKYFYFFYGLVLFSISTVAQSPQAFNWQGVITDSNGDALADTAVGLKFEIHQGTAAGTVVYTETQNLTTASTGLISTVIGNAGSTTVFDSMDWSTGSFYLEVGVDTSGGTNYTSLGTSQLLSVPYAMYAGSSPLADELGGLIDGDFAANSVNTVSNLPSAWQSDQMAAQGNYLVFYNDDSDLLQLYDNSDPSNPSFADSANVPVTFTGVVGERHIAMSGNLIAVAQSTGSCPSAQCEFEITIYSVDAGFNLIEEYHSGTTLGTEDGDPFTFTSSLPDQFEIVADRTQWVINATVPSSPTINRTTLNVSDQAIASNNGLIVSYDDYELSVMTADTGTLVRNSSTFPDIGYVTINDAITDDYFYIPTDVYDEIVIYDLSNRASPAEAARFTPVFNISNSDGFFLMGDTFIHQKGADIAFYDVSNPLVPNFTRQESLGSVNKSRSVVSGNYLYFLDQDDSLYTYDLTFGADFITIDALGNMTSVPVDDVTAEFGDDLGDHTATQDIDLSGLSLIDGNATTKLNINSTDDALQILRGNDTVVQFLPNRLDLLHTSSESMFIGHDSGKNADERFSTNNTGVGYQALASITTGSYNTVLGNKALNILTTGSGNTAIGSEAGLENNGTNNTFIGDLAGAYSGSGSSNVFIGNGSGYYETGSNKLYIENSLSSSPLIYGEFDNDLVRINGDFEVTGDLTFSDGTTQTTAATGDDLGNHTATQNLNIGNFYINNGNGPGGLNVNGYGFAYLTGYNNTSLSLRSVLDSSNNVYYDLGTNLSTTLSDSEAYFEMYTDNSAIQRLLTFNGSNRTTIGDGTSGDLVVSNDLTITNGDLTFSDGTTQSTAATADNLGNHTATQTINTDNNWISGDGDSEGIQIADDGDVTTSGHVTVGSNFSARTFYPTNWVNGTDRAMQVPQNTWMRFRTGGSGSGRPSGVILSDTDARHYFLYNQNDTFIIRYSNENSDDPKVTNSTTGENLFVMNTAGNVTIDGSLSQNSDARLKKNLEPVTGALDKINQITAYYYEWIDAERRGDARQLGLIAQEVQKVAPELVSENEEGILSVNYAQMSALIIAALQEEVTLSRKREQQALQKTAALRTEVDAIKEYLGLTSETAVKND